MITWGYLATFVCGYLAIRLAGRRVVGSIEDYRNAQMARHKRQLAQAYTQLNLEKLTAYSFLAGLALAIFAFFYADSLLLAAFAMLLALVVPKVVTSHLEKRRIEKFEEQFPDALGILSNSLRAGLSMPNALNRVAEESQWPVSDEFERLHGDLSIGKDEAAWLDLVKRNPLPSVKLFAVAILTCGGRGVNFAEMSERIAETIRKNIELKRELDAMTAEGRMQGWLMASLPFVMGGLLYLVSPDFIMPLFTTTAGYLIIVMILIMLSIGGLVIKDILTLEEE